MLSLLTTETTTTLKTFLESTLPEIQEDWWTQCVVSVLTFSQQRIVEENSITNLSGLDLAALLRIFDRNWSEISYKKSLPRDARNWIKEMQSIRNRWAHKGSAAVSQDDLYRDYDTLQRFLEIIDANLELVEQIRAKKLTCQIPVQPLESENSPQPLPAIEDTEFKAGDIIALIADPDASGVVTKVISSSPENRYEVFLNGEISSYYASQLTTPVVSKKKQELASLNDFHAYLSALQLRHPGLAHLYSLHAARINYIPYQFKPVMKLIRSDRPRLLIADEVGVGKTIEAGLILREIQARRDINSVLIICPKPLVTERKWQTEMKRFDEHFEHLDGPTLRYCIEETDQDACWPDRYSKVILPFSLFSEEMLTGTTQQKTKKNIGLYDLDPFPHFDIVIVDEAHHLRNQATYVHQGVKYFCDNAEAVVFLTATPIQLGNQDLFVLLNMLRPDLIIDPASFNHMSEPNPYINRTIELARSAQPEWQDKAKQALQKAVNTSWGRSIIACNPEFQRIFDLLGSHLLSSEERISFIRDAEQLHTFSSLINRTRRRDIGEFTIRKPETVSVEFTEDQQGLHDAVLSLQAKILSRIHGDRNLKFMMTTIRRQAASCLYGLAPFLEEILTRRIDLLELEEADETAELYSLAGVTEIEDEIKFILDIAKILDPSDPKLEAFKQIVEEKQLLTNNKVMLFSSFRHTLNYLVEHLRASDVRVGLIHGNIPDEQRRELRNRFSFPKEDPEALDVLLSSEVGCEGLDYQFCDCLVNYDLPWNPMRIEQRIGRIDRYGQKSETVAIYNLITPGTVDADIYSRCLWRIGVFHNAIGGSEEILGHITSQIKEVAENLNLTDEERQGKLQQLSDNEIRLIEEQAELEEKQMDLFGLRLPSAQTEQEINQAASFWLTSESLQNLVQKYLEVTCETVHEFILGENALKTLRLSQDGRRRLLDDFRKLPRKISPIYREWERWLKGPDQHLGITFDATCAAEHREVNFLTPVHPLALQASHCLGMTGTLYTAFKLSSYPGKSGHYPFVIYRWKKHGLREDVSFQPICSDLDLNKNFLTLLESAQSIDPESIKFPEQHVFDALDALHHTLWVSARSEHQSHNLMLAQYRKESLNTSHRARMDILQEQFGSANNEKIRRMRESEIAQAEADYQRRLADILRAENLSDISTQAVAYGVIVVEG